MATRFNLYFLLCLVSAALPGLTAAPVINSIANAASNNFFNSPIAQGAVFVIKGTGLGPATLTVSSAPFQSTTLSGTSVAVTVGSTTVNALMYYTSDTQVAALLPSNTPINAPGMFTVTYNGDTSSPVGHGVTVSNLGLLTLDSSGAGPAIVTYASDYSLVSAAKASNCGGPNTACGAANPGDSLSLWGTGLGPVNGDDASGAGLGQNMPNIPLTVWLGGVKAPVSFQGRGCCVGVDQVFVTVPDNVPTGCAVPLVVQIGTNTNTISNSTVLPIAKGSRNCTPTNPAFATVEQAVLTGPATYGSIELNRRLNDNGNGYQDVAKLDFSKVLATKPGTGPFFVSWIDDPPPGTCVVFNNLNAAQGPPPIGSIADADAGSSFTFKGPNGSVAVMGNPGQFQATLSAAGTFFGPGAYSFTGTGGADVGPINASLTLPDAPKLVSPLTPNNLNVIRSNGMPVTWSGGDPNGTVQISVASATDRSFTVGGSAVCNVAASAGAFTIPPYVMLRLPPGNFSLFEFAPVVASAGFTAPGLPIGILSFYHDGTIFSGFGLN